MQHDTDHTCWANSSVFCFGCFYSCTAEQIRHRTVTVMQYNLLMLRVTFFCFITHMKTERENHSHTHMDTWSVFSLNFSTGGRQGTPKPLTLNQLTCLSAARYTPLYQLIFPSGHCYCFNLSHTHTHLQLSTIRLTNAAVLTQTCTHA